jgi:hypothetical protein
MLDTTDPIDASGELGPNGAPETPENPEQEKDEILSQFRRRLAASKSHSKDWRTEARNLYDVAAGHQWADEDAAMMKEKNRPMVTFNVMGKFLDAVSGLQINNRQDIRYFPREAGDSALNELLTGSVTWARDICDLADEETEGFYDVVLTGMGWVEGFLNDEGEPAGWPAGERRDPLEMYWDPQARKKNLSDARYVIRVKGLDREDYRDRFGEDPGSMPELSGITLDDDASPQVIESPHDYGDSGRGTGQDGLRRGKVPVADYQYWKKEKRIEVTTQGYGDKTFTPAEWAQVEPLLKLGRIPYQFKSRVKKVYYRCFIDASGVKTKEESPYQLGFTFHAITGKRDRNTNTWYGIGRSMKDPQQWMNKFFSSILDILMRNSKGGLIVEENTFENPDKARSEWGAADSITVVAEGALQKGKLQEKKQTEYPQGLDRLMQFSLDALPATSGLNMEMLGMVDREQSAVLEAGRKQSAMAIIAWAFDAMRRYYRSMGRQMACYIRDYVDEGTLVRINGENGAQYVPLLKDKLALTFDIIVDEAPTSVNMKERVWAALEKLIPQAIQAGIKVPPEVLDYSPIPQDLAAKWKDTLKGDPQQAQADQQKQEKQFEAMLRKVLGEAANQEASAKDKQASAVLKQEQAQNLAAENDPAHRQLHDAELMANVQHKQADSIHMGAQAGALQAGGM